MSFRVDGMERIRLLSFDGQGWDVPLPEGCAVWSLTADDASVFALMMCGEHASMGKHIAVAGANVVGLSLSSGDVVTAFRAPPGTVDVLAVGDGRLVVSQLVKVSALAGAEPPPVWSDRAYETHVALLTAAGKQVWRALVSEGPAQLRSAFLDSRRDLWLAGTGPCKVSVVEWRGSVFVMKVSDGGTVDWTAAFACDDRATALGGWRETARGVRLVGRTAMPPPALEPPGPGDVAVDFDITRDGELSVDASRVLGEYSIATGAASRRRGGRTTLATSHRCDRNVRGGGRFDDRCGRVSVLGDDGSEQTWTLSADDGGVIPIAAVEVDGDVVIACFAQGTLRIDGVEVLAVDHPSLVGLRVRRGGRPAPTQ